MSVITEEPAAPEYREEPFHPPRVDPAYRGDFVAADFGDVQQAADLHPVVGHDDPPGDRQRHERYERHDERGEPRREVSAFVEVVEQPAQQPECGQIDDRPIEGRAAETVFIDALHRFPYLLSDPVTLSPRPLPGLRAGLRRG